VGTGGATGRTAIDQLVDKVEKLRASHHAKPMVPIYFAALGPRMVRAAFQHAEGVLLNFCSPGYVRRITRGIARRDGHRVACYIKLFFGETDAEAIRMLADEFVKYDSAPQYHAMFQAMGLSDAIEGFRSRGDISERSIPEKIEEISLYNPTREQILQVIARFEEEGVDLPVVYPYVATRDDDFRIKTVAMLSQLAR
jgi:alkanesulfonate monooxygenase SsuD/methylene tetrahydromethanopterin reductase-like flavin-dependent oxidoreductase (luciferase family)